MSAFEHGWGRRVGQAAAAVTLIAFSTGCYRSRNVVTMEPLDTKVPVSASGQYIDQGGRIVTEDEYEIVDSFSFEKNVEAPRHRKRQADLELEAEIDSIVAAANGEAVTDLKIEGIDYKTGGHGSAAMWKQFGWIFGITGGTLIIAGAASGDPDLTSVAYPMGGVFAGLGAVSFGLALTARKPTEWTFSVGGNVVATNGAAPPPQPTEPEPEGGSAAAPAQDAASDDDAVEPLAE